LTDHPSDRLAKRAPVPTEIDGFWQSYLRSLPREQRNRFYYEAFAFGHTAHLADRLGRLVLEGVKTATSELLWARERIGKPLWKVGDGRPICVIRTTELSILSFVQVDQRFA